MIVIHSMILCLLVKPARTKCSIEGPQQIGKDVILKCASQEGSPLLSYDWRRVSGTQELPATSVLSTVKLFFITLKHLSKLVFVFLVYLDL